LLQDDRCVWYVMTMCSALLATQGRLADPQDPHRSLYDFDDANTVIQLGDWYHKVSPVCFNDPLIVP
jgi:hypothetical protein